VSEQNRGPETLLAFLLGAAVGVAAGLLLAPRSGKETRRRVQRWVDDLEDRGADLLEEGKELLEEGKDAVQAKAKKLKGVIDSGRKAWDEVRRRD
jgi:gas vesicle protein